MDGVRAADAAAGPRVIEFRAVSKTYRSMLGRDVVAVEDVSFVVAPGEVVGIAGPNGAGKSTLIALLLGYLSPTRGAVRIHGLAPRPYIERHGIGYLSELVAIRPRWTAEEALRRYATLAAIPPATIRARVEAAMARLGIEEHRSKRIRALSKGNLQRLGLAQALLRDESVLVLDEPTHGLDPLWTQRFRGLMDALRDPGRAILIASHNLDELQRVADRVVIIDRGRVQRVVELRHDASAALAPYRLVVTRGAELMSRVFPTAEPLGSGMFEVRPADLEALNRGLAELLTQGALLSAVAPAHSVLEEQFREAVHEPATRGDLS